MASTTKQPKDVVLTSETTSLFVHAVRNSNNSNSTTDGDKSAPPRFVPSPMEHFTCSSRCTETNLNNLYSFMQENPYASLSQIYLWLNKNLHTCEACNAKKNNNRASLF